jgi:hypothetical protein
VPILLQKSVAVDGEQWSRPRTMLSSGGLAMMGRLQGDQSQLFYEFLLDEVIPADQVPRADDARPS